MIKQIAWDTFKNTGNIDTFMEFKQIEELEKNLDSSTGIKEIEMIQKITNVNLENENK